MPLTSPALKLTSRCVRSLSLPLQRTAEYDDMFDKYTLLRQVDERTSVRLVQMKGIWPTAPREFVLLSSWAELSDGSLLIFSRSPAPEETGAAATRSKTGSLNPLAAALMETPSKGYVRGSVVVSGYHIQPIAPMIGSPSKKVGTEAKGSSAACRVTLVAHTELGGSLPSSVINSLATGAPVKLLQGLSAVLERRR